MIRTLSPVLFATPFLGCLVFAAGCGGFLDASSREQLQPLLLAEEPAGAVTIEDARKNLDQQSTVVLIGRIGARDKPQWWYPKSGTLVVSEGFADSEYNVSADHDPSTCPFCKWKWKQEDSFAVVRLVDSQGNPVTADVPRLLGLKEEDVLVIRGNGRLNDSGILTLTADGFFIRSKT